MSVEWNEAALHELFDDPEGPVGREMERRAIRGETEAKRLLSLPGSGRVYQKYRPRRLHQASAPGEPPAVDTGLLRASVGHRVGADAEGVFAEWGVMTGAEDREGGTTIDHIGVWLETGTRHMEPRPWLRPSIPAAEA